MTSRARHAVRGGVLAAAVFLALPLRAEETRMRIGVLVRVRAAPVGPGKVAVKDLETGKKQTLALGRKTVLEASSSGLRLGGKPLGKKVALEGLGDGGVRVNDRLYRDRVEVRWTAAGAFTAVNVLAVDDYVRGILVHEANPSWPPEALKVQAVASRTYALKNRGRHASDGFDLCAEPHCQVYGGKSSERDACNRAVQATRGEAVFHKGQIISAVFHSCCGGMTDEASNIWEGPGLPYLKAVKCRWCRGSPRFKWSAELDPRVVGERLRAAGHDVGEPRSLKVLSRSRSGRAYEVRIIGTRGQKTLRANEFRTLTDGRVMRSTFWTAVSEKRRLWRFDGKGWGHGVGLCQWGAEAMARKGKDYKEILRFYYKDVVVARIRT